MPIELFCSNFECRTKLKVRENQAGKKIRCPKCKTVSTAPIDTRDSAMGSGTGYEATMVQEVSDSVSGESEQIDATADRFEQAWQDSSETGEQPRIEDYLSGLNGKTHSRLLKELLYLEIELRLRKGERVDPEDYSDRFPDWTSDLAAAIESIQVSLQSIRENPGLRTGKSVPASTTAIAPNDTGSSMNLRRLSDVLTQTSPAHQRYRSRHEIAKGGMGVVNLCIDESINRPVAMKVMRERLSNSKEGRVRFLEEAQITGQLEHPNIVPIHELGQDAEGNLYFTMKLVKGKSLGEILKEMKAVESGPALQSGSELSHILAGHSLTELLKVFLKVCDGIAFAHSKGVIHRDLKPDNIMVGDFGEVLVMDWGLAKVLGPDRISQTPSRRLEEIKESEVSDEEAGRLADTVSASGIGNPASLPQSDTASIEYRVSSIRSDSDIARTMGGAVQGTPQYMPPEQAEGDIEKIDHRSDIYSLGAILYELLTLKRSVQGKTVHEVLLKVTEGKILAPHKRAPERHIPKELSAICVKAMQKHRHRRYQSAKEVASDINLYLEGRAVSAKEDTFWETLVKLFKRNRGVSIAVGAASIIFSIGLVLAFTKITKEKNQAVWQKERAQKAREEQYQTALSYSKKSAEQAVRAAEQSRWDEAITRVEAARGVLSDGPWGFYAEGMLLWHKKEFLEAEEHLENAVKRLRIIEGTLPEDLKKVTTVLASIKTSLGKVTEAAALVGNLEEIKDWRSLVHAGNTLTEAGDYIKAEKVFARALKLMTLATDVPPEVRQPVEESLESVQAAVKCIGLWDSVKTLSAEEQAKRLLDKFTEIHKGPAGVNFAIKDGALETLMRYTHFPGTLRHLQPLKGVPLKGLDITGAMELKDLGPLRGMPLKGLGLQATSVEDLSPLKGMPLESLNLTNSKEVKDLSPLEGIRLKVLSLELTAVESIRPLKGMPLESLRLASMHKLKSFEGIEGMPLKSLVYSTQGHPLRDLSPMRGLQLEFLQINAYSVADITPLNGMPLHHLNLASCAVRDLSPLAGMPLRKLSLYGCQVIDLSPLQGMQLEELDCRGTQVRDLTPLKAMPLTCLYLDKAPVEDLSPLEAMKTLKDLNSNETHIKSLLALKNLSLDSLSIHRTEVKDLTPLKGMNLRHLGISGLKDLTPESLKLIEEFKKRGCKIDM